MKASVSFAVGIMAFSLSLVATGSPAPSPGLVHKKKGTPYEAQPPVLCLIGTEKCSAKRDPPMAVCQLGAEKSESCSTDGVKVIGADWR